MGVVVVAAGVAAAVAAGQEAGLRFVASSSEGLVVDFAEDPLQDPDAVFEGDAVERVRWEPSPPRFPGDAPGHLSALYRSDRPAGRVGWALPQPLGRDDTFTAAAVLVFDPEHFEADPFGFFQISWGLWNQTTTGLDRTGSPKTQADSYELVEWNYFPNVSPLFGGPYLSPSVFGVELEDTPDAFANFTFASVETELPLGVPLLTTMEHRAGADAVVVSVQKVLGDGSLLPIDGAVAVVPLGWLVQEEYTVDRAGLTLWSNGYEEPGGEAQVDARVEVHLLSVRRGRVISVPATGGGTR